MNPRFRRLAADHREVLACYEHHPRIKVISTEGSPPEKYLIEFQLASMVPEGRDSCLQGDTHRAEVVLPMDYPRRPPFCRMVTPVFHPNISPQRICIGDHWSAGQRLCDLIQHIGEMLLFQSYNVKSPLNGEAARWAEQNAHILPLEPIDLSANGSAS